MTMLESAHATVTPARVIFSTRSAVEASAWLSETLRRPLRLDPHPAVADNVGLDATGISWGELSLLRVAFAGSMQMTLTEPAREVESVCEVRDGILLHAAKKLTPGAITLPPFEGDCKLVGVTGRIIVFDRAALTAAAHVVGHTGEVRFHDPLPVSPEATARMHRLFDAIEQHAKDDAASRSRLLTHVLTTAVASTALEVYPNNVIGLSHLGSQELSRVVLRKAEAFIDANIATPITKSDIARAAGVSVSTLARMFQTQHGVTPMAYVRNRRMRLIHQELVAADPTTTTVTRVLRGRGVTNNGRFAAEYRKAFGVTPYETLHS